MPDGVANYSAMHFMGLALDYLSVSGELPLDIEKMAGELETVLPVSNPSLFSLELLSAHYSDYTRSGFVGRSNEKAR
ncbi:MAG: hypothetical protein A2Z75_01850 [Chloroflexi bacterium RBG_13_50_10]|jgi:hypothetical protein|nr:MAG: hypothetical protein A2Z75_01850 [Chloroflexi bacterium RBG_13_50_10]